MSAYVVVEATVLDQEARDRYGSQASAVLKQFGAEVVTFGPWQLLCGERGHDIGRSSAPIKAREGRLLDI